MIVSIIVAIVLVVVLVAIIESADVRSQNRAKAGGCICQHGLLVSWIRSDCPYHSRSNQ